MSDQSDAIAALDALITSGVASVNVDGQSVSLDPAALRKARRDLAAKDDVERHRRPVISRILFTNSM